MAPDDDAEDRPLGKPLPPDDRLWRHPSEVHNAGGDPTRIVLIERPAPSIGRTLAVALVASLLGAGATLAIVLTTDVAVRELPGTTSHEVRDVSPRSPGENEIAIAEQVLDSVVRVEATGPKGAVNATAVVFRSDGQVVTTADAVDAADHITVSLSDGRRFSTPDVSLVGKSLDGDVALLRIPARDLPVAAGTNRRVRFGDQAVLVDASPLTKGPAIAVGVVTREVAQINRENLTPVYGLIQTTTKASVPALSAGTLFLDDAGSVIGLASGRAEGPRASATGASTTVRSASGARALPAAAATEENALHYAIPADFVWDVAAQLADDGQVTKPWVGLPRGEDITAEEASREQIIGGGMRVTHIEEDSPAKQAKLQRGDIIVNIGGENVDSFNSFVAALRRQRRDTTVTFTVLRRGEYAYPDVYIGGKPEL